jgi:hypothetical protein
MEDGSWQEPQQLDVTASGAPQVAIDGAGNTLLVGGRYNFWSIQSMDGKTWSEVRRLPMQRDTQALNGSLQLSQTPSGRAMMVWTDCCNLPDHLFAKVGLADTQAGRTDESR